MLLIVGQHFCLRLSWHYDHMVVPMFFTGTSCPIVEAYAQGSFELFHNYPILRTMCFSWKNDNISVHKLHMTWHQSHCDLYKDMTWLGDQYRFLQDVDHKHENILRYGSQMISYDTIELGQSILVHSLAWCQTTPCHEMNQSWLSYYH